MTPTARISKTLGLALITGALSAGALMLASSLHAQTPPPAAPTPAPAPAAAPAPPPAAVAAPPPTAPAPGTIPVTQVPFYASWASSPHADHKAAPFNHWNKEGNIPVACARCHSTPGFQDYLGADGSTPFKVDYPAPVGTVITCVACHNSKTVSLTKVTFPSGIAIEHLGPSVRCMTCHQGVESTKSVNEKLAGLRDDAVTPKLDFINVHYTAAASMLYGNLVKVGYEYTGKTYAGRFEHKAPYTTCTACHQTHALAVKINDCMACHKEVTDKASLHLIRADKIDRDGNGNINEGVAQELDHLRAMLLATIQDYAKSVVGKPVIYEAEVYPYFFNDLNGNGKADKDEAKFPNRYKSWTPRLMKAAYNVV